MQPSLWRLLRRNRVLSLALLAVLALFVAIILPEVIGAGSVKITDSTPCSTWGASSQLKQDAYARLYVKQHGPLRGGATSPASVVTAVNTGCTAAFGYDEADNIDVLQAIKGQY
jgi:hypothetical protein